MPTLWRIRALAAEIAAARSAAAGAPADDRPGEAAFDRALAALAAAPAVAARTFGTARDGTSLRAFALAPPERPDAPTILVVGVPRGDAPSGAGAVLALARRLAADDALRAKLGVRWTFVPCADPAGARDNAAWWPAPTLERHARGVVVAPPGEDSPERRALRALIAADRPQVALALDDAPTGGFALRAAGPASPWGDRAADFARLLDPTGLPLAPDDPPAPADPYARWLADHADPFGAAFAALAPPEVAVGAIVSPLFADYARRERDRTLADTSRREVAAEGIRLWREWFAFGRTDLDLLAPPIPATGLADSPAHRALLAALRGGDAILAGGLRWPERIPDPDAPATIAEAFAQGDAVRLARLPRLAALVRFLAAARAAAPDPAAAQRAPGADALDRALDTQTRWIDELAAPATLRPPRRDRALAAQIGGVLLAI